LSAKGTAEVARPAADTVAVELFVPAGTPKPTAGTESDDGPVKVTWPDVHAVPHWLATSTDNGANASPSPAD
jgi:hypothetical protein